MSAPLYYDDCDTQPASPVSVTDVPDIDSAISELKRQIETHYAAIREAAQMLVSLRARRDAERRGDD